MPHAKPRGRPAEFCSTVCRQRATLRRRRAAQRLEFALRLDELAAEIRAGLHGRSYGYPESQEKRAAKLREDAERELRGLPL
jgi:hypothetical protein